MKTQAPESAHQNNEEKNFRNKRKKYLLKWVISSIIASAILIPLYFIEKTNNNPYLPIGTTITDATIIALTIAGMSLSIVSFFFSINVAYSSILDAINSQNILSKLQDISNNTNEITIATKKLLEPVADATRKPLPSLTECLNEISIFLEKATEADQLYILTDTSAVGKIHTYNTNLRNPDFNKKMSQIHANMINRARDTKDFRLAVLDEENLINKYVNPVIESTRLVCENFLQNENTIKQDIINLHRSTIETMKSEYDFNKDNNNTFTHFSIKDLPFQLFLRRNGTEYRAIIIFIGSYNTKLIHDARGIMIKNDIELIKSCFSLFDSFVESQNISQLPN